MFRLKPALLFFSFLLLFAACSSQSSTPARPDSVPKDAMWVGGIDGGAWVLLKNKQSNPEYIYYAEIYGDQAGDRWYIGKLEVEPHSSATVPLDNPDAFGVWDGDNLLLKDGRVMRATDAFDPFKVAK